MEDVPPHLYDPQDYIRTTTGNLVGRKAHVHGAQHVNLRGKCIVRDGAILRGDLAPVKVGRYCFLEGGVILRPGYRLRRDAPSGGGQADSLLRCVFAPLQIGNYTVVGKGCVISAASVGSHVRIGEDCVLGASCIIKDNCLIEAGTVIPAEAVVPPFSRVKGCPGKIVSDLPESTPVLHQGMARALYDSFSPADVSANESSCL